MKLNEAIDEKLNKLGPDGIKIISNMTGLSIYTISRLRRNEAPDPLINRLKLMKALDIKLNVLDLGA